MSLDYLIKHRTKVSKSDLNILALVDKSYILPYHKNWNFIDLNWL